MRLRSPLTYSLVAAAAIAGLLAGPSAGASPTGGRHEESLVGLTDLAAQRIQLADLVAAAKWGTDSPINDPAREQVVLDTAAAKSVELGIDPEISKQIFKDQIEANKVVQYGLYSYWTAHPDTAPTTRPDLPTEVRPKLDKITDELLAQLKATQHIRVERKCDSRLESAAQRVDHARKLDHLHDEALGRALVSVCR